MEMKDCIKDPQFRREFILHEIEGLKKIVEGNENVIYHNDAKLSILREIKESSLGNTEDSIVKEHIDALESLNKELAEQKPKLEKMIEIYERFVNISHSTLKLA